MDDRSQPVRAGIHQRLQHVRVGVRYRYPLHVQVKPRDHNEKWNRNDFAGERIVMGLRTRRRPAPVERTNPSFMPGTGLLLTGQRYQHRFRQVSDSDLPQHVDSLSCRVLGMS